MCIISFVSFNCQCYCNIVLLLLHCIIMLLYYCTDIMYLYLFHILWCQLVLDLWNINKLNSILISLFCKSHATALKDNEILYFKSHISFLFIFNKLNIYNL
jgi:hypothetical protein